VKNTYTTTLIVSAGYFNKSGEVHTHLMYMGSKLDKSDMPDSTLLIPPIDYLIPPPSCWP
jgi:hypothetical protein